MRTFWLILMIGSGASGGLSPRQTYCGFFGKAEYVSSDDVGRSINEGSILAFSFASAMKNENLYPWEGGVLGALTFGQAGKSKLAIIPRISWIGLGEEFSPFLFSIGVGLGPAFLFLKSANYGALTSQWFVSTEIDLGLGMALGGESSVELPLTNASENPPSVSVFIKLSYRE